jgi:pimeloyl-ACP methyl ester carboxylesterase
MSKLSYFLIVALLCCLLTTTVVSRRTLTEDLEQHLNSLELYSNSPIQSNIHETQYFQNLVDHFNPLNTERYAQRFWVNSQFYNPEAKHTPIFLHLCCEGPCSEKWVTKGASLMANWAEETGGLLVAIEHRFYGESQPGPDWTLESLQYLTLEQALADAAYFIKFHLNARKEFNINQDHPITVVGGSYGGTMAQAMRHYYPNFVHQAIAASGVYDPRFDLSDFLDACIEGIRFYGGDQCLNDVSIATGYLTQILKNNNPVELARVSRLLPLSVPFNNTDTVLDRQAFWQLFTDSFIQIIQYNKENNPSYYSVSDMCRDFSNETTPTRKFELLAQIHRDHIMSGSNYRWKFKQQVEDIGDVTLHPRNNMRQWYFQCVTAYGWWQPQTPNSKRVFGGEYDMKYMMTLLKESYGDRFDETFMRDRIAAQNAKLNQYHILQSNTIFTSGDIDPWKVLAVQRNNNDLRLTSYHIPRTAHCAPLYAPTPYDPEPQVEAVKQMFQDFKQSLEWFPKTLTNDGQ